MARKQATKTEEILRNGPSEKYAEELAADPTGLATMCLCDVEPEPVRWLVPGYLPLGKLVLIAGDGGHGKSTLTLGLAAALSTGRPAFGLDYPNAVSGETLLVSCEDDLGDTVVPRLLATGADLTKIRSVVGCPLKGGKPTPFSLAHYQRLEEELEARPDVRLVVIDPAGAYVGRSGIDDNNDTELRTLLGPLAELAARRRVTILLVKHLIKGATTKAVHKVGGSAGYINTVRAAFVVATRPDDERRLFMPLKFNLGPKPQSLSYCMVSITEAEAKTILAPFKKLKADDRKRIAAQLFRLHWEIASDADADAVLGEQARSQQGNKVAQAAAWLLEALRVFAFPSDEIFEAANRDGFTKDNIYKAKEANTSAIKASNRGASRGAWWWGLGDPQQWRRRPEGQTCGLPSETHNSPNSPNSGPGNGRSDLGDLGDLGVLGRGPTDTEVCNEDDEQTDTGMTIFDQPPD